MTLVLRSSFVLVLVLRYGVLSCVPLFCVLCSVFLCAVFWLYLSCVLCLVLCVLCSVVLLRFTLLRTEVAMFVDY